MFYYQNSVIITGNTTVYSGDQIASNSSHAIAILTDKNYKQLRKLLSSIDEYLLDGQKSHLIIFHSGYPFTSDIANIIQSTKRRIIFRNVDREFASFPSGFNPYTSDPTWSKRGKWNYHHMIRFWFKLLFDIVEIHQYDYIMRLDDDSQLLGVWLNIFQIMREKNAVYLANDEGRDFEDGLPGTMKLKNICLAYLHTVNATADITKKLEEAFDKESVKTYYNNFEIMNTHFFRQIAVRNWVQMIDQSHGIYRYRWGDAILRYLTLMIFADEKRILHRKDYNLSYCHPCTLQ